MAKRDTPNTYFAWYNDDDRLAVVVRQESSNTTKGTTSGGDSDPELPSWLRKNAGWWSQGLLSDDEFFKSIQWMINNEFIKI